MSLLLCVARRQARFIFLVLLVLAALTFARAQLNETGGERPIDREDAIEVTPARDKMYEAMVNAQDKKYDEAIPKLEWVIATDPTLLGAWETLGWSYWMVGREKDAAELWQRLLTIAPDEPMAYNLLAQVATRDGDLERAEELYAKSLELKPEQFETRLSYARVLLWGGKREQAVEKLRQLFREDPDRLDVEIDLAWAMYANEEYEDVLDIWNHIIEIIPDAPGYLLARANVFVLIGSLTEAEADAREVLEIEKDNIGAFNLLADLAVRAKRPEEAVDALRKIMAMAEDSTAKGRVARRIAGYMKSVYDLDPTVFTLQQCLQAAREAWETDKRDVNGYLLYGEMLVVDKQYAQAANIFQEVIDNVNPFSSRARTGLLETYFGRMMLDEAEKQLSENLRMFNPSNPFRHLYWARLHQARGDYAAALESLDRLEREGAQGAVFTLLYHGLSPSEWSDMPSVRQFRDHMMTLRREGFQFITPSQLDDYFKTQEAPPLTDPPPALYRFLQKMRYAWTGQRPEAPRTLSDHSPDKIVCVTFDDALRNSLRYGNQVAEELQIPITLFVPVGDVLARGMYVASFPEIRDFMNEGHWEMHSHLWDSGQPFDVDAEGHQAYPLANLLWLPDKDRQESLREYHARLRREFRDSRRVLARELKISEDEITAVAYPIGDIGQETTCNIDAFNVPEVILNEAEVTYRMGFLQHRFGYAMQTDNPMLYKRHEPSRTASGRDVLRAAYQQHPVYLARRMRAEMAALNGQLHLANSMIELLKRDNYPEEDLLELNTYVQNHLARLSKIPDSISDVTVGAKEPLFAPRRPFIGIEGRSTKANVMIEDWQVGAYAGLNLNPRLVLEVRAGIGGIKQEVKTNTWIEVDRTTVSSSRSIVRTVENGQVTNSEETRTTYSTSTTQSNVVETFNYKAEETMVGGAMNFTHRNGSFTVLDVRNHSFKGDEFEDESLFSVALEHQWRPTAAIDMSARYQHAIVPSARKLLEYDALALRGIWRIEDWWHANGLASFSLYQDNNSYLHAGIENFWRLAERHDIWFGIHNSVDTVDRESDLYWTPYWDQRHYLVMRMRRSYPNYFGMVRVNLGLQKGKARPEELERYNNNKARGEAQGWYPGESPEQDWASLLGIGASVTRTWRNGWELSAEFSVNAIRDYTEHTLSGRLQYRF